MEQVVVVGAGLAGLRSIVELRSRGFDGRLVLIGAEEHPPYDRPPLSKRYLIDDEPSDPVLEVDWAALDVDRRFGVAATEIRGGSIATTTGAVTYDQVVIATGSRPIRLPGDPGQRVLRTRDDAESLRGALKEGTRFVIVGAGWIGAEVATAAARHGCEVTVLEAGHAPVAAVLPPEVGRLTAPWYAQHGVALRTATPVAAVEPDGAVLESGERVPADVLLVSIGVRPAVDWLSGGHVPVDRGVLVGPDLAAADRVWAVGDAAARWSPRYADRIRGEHWDDALHAPQVVAANVLGGKETYDPVPYVWSEQFGRLVQWIGHHRGADSTVWRGDPTRDAAWAVAWLRAGRLLGLLAVDRPRDVLQARRIAARDGVVDPTRLADPGMAIRDAVAE